MPEHPKITAAREALADTQRRAEADMELRAKAVASLCAWSPNWFATTEAMMSARRAWKSAVNRKANAVERAIRVYGGDDAK